MTNLTSPSEIKRLMQSKGIAPLKKLGQNFLIDENVLDIIERAADISAEDDCLEIGSGLGALTERLCNKAKNVVAVEIDSGMVDHLRLHFAGQGNLRVIHDDVLKNNSLQRAASLLHKGFITCSNLPYYITTPIIMSILEKQIGTRRMVFMVQKEVAERFSANPGTKAYNALSVAVQYFCDVEYVATVSGNCFMPAPDVDSAIVRLDKKQKRADVGDETFFLSLIKLLFAMRRKTLLNNIISSGLGMDRKQALDLMERHGLNPEIRAERLDIDTFASISKELSNRKMQ